MPVCSPLALARPVFLTSSNLARSEAIGLFWVAYVFFSQFPPSADAEADACWWHLPALVLNQRITGPNTAIVD